MLARILRVWSGQSSQADQVRLHSPDRSDHVVRRDGEELAQYNTADARALFSDLLRRVRGGEEIVIAHAGRPVAKLVPYHDVGPRRPGVIRAHLVIDERPKTASPERAV